MGKSRRIGNPDQTLLTVMYRDGLRAHSRHAILELQKQQERELC